MPVPRWDDRASELPAPFNAARGGHSIMSVDNSSATQTAATDGSKRVAGAIKQASSQTGVSFEYMLTTAKMESDFDPTAGATTSSAHGLYQFIDQTWLGTVKEAGTQLGYGSYSDAISKTSSGTYTVDDPMMKQSNSFKLTGLLGRRPSDSELYMAHFMGVGGAAKLIANAEDNPQAVGARLFPNAAAANRSIFYAKHAGVSLDLSARRRHAAGLDDGAEIVGQQCLADLGRTRDLGRVSHTRRAATAAARSLQRSQRNVLKLIFIFVSRTRRNASAMRRRAGTQLAHKE